MLTNSDWQVVRKVEWQGGSPQRLLPHFSRGQFPPKQWRQRLFARPTAFSPTSPCLRSRQNAGCPELQYAVLGELRLFRVAL